MSVTRRPPLQQANMQVTGEQYRALGYGNPDEVPSTNGMYNVPDGSSSSGGSSADDYLSSSISSITSLIQKLKPYDQANPFAFDEVLAREASTAEYAPYYKELLSDYTSDVERTKSRSGEDLASTLKQLQAGQEYYSGQQRRSIDQAIKSSNEGFAGRGLYMSGARGKEAGRLENEYQLAYGPEGYQTGQYLASQAKAKTGSERTIADANTLASRYTRDNARDLEYGIESGVQQRKGEYIQQYETGRKNYYQNQIPGGYFTGIYG